MRAFGVIAVLVGLVSTAVPVPASAQDADALRRELEQMRRQFEGMQQQYQKAMEALNDRLRRLETRPEPVAAPPAAPAPGVAPEPALTQAATRQPSTLDLLRPREPFALSQQRGAGQVLFDMGIAGDFVANVTQHNVDKANAGSFPNRENRLFPRAIELNLFGQVDPYARADVRIEAGEERAGPEIGVNLAEAALTLLTLPYGTQLKLGQMRSRFGLTNAIHEDALPYIDRPNVYRAFVGEEGLVEKGAELTVLPDLPFYLEGLLGVFNGDNETAFGRGKLTEPLLTSRLRTFFELTDTSAVQFGLSGAHGRRADHNSSTLAGFDAKYKYRPEGWLHPLLTLGSEGLYSVRKTKVGDDVESPVEDRTRHRFGWYGYGELQPFRRWAAGLRYDSTQYPLNPGHEWAVEPYLTFLPSDFLSFRLGYKHTDRSHRDGFTDNGGSARIVDEFLLRATFILGAHPAHPF